MITTSQVHSKPRFTAVFFLCSFMKGYLWNKRLSKRNSIQEIYPLLK